MDKHKFREQFPTFSGLWWTIIYRLHCTWLFPPNLREPVKSKTQRWKENCLLVSKLPVEYRLELLPQRCVAAPNATLTPAHRAEQSPLTSWLLVPSPSSSLPALGLPSSLEKIAHAVVSHNTGDLHRASPWRHCHCVTIRYQLLCLRLPALILRVKNGLEDKAPKPQG